ncbi:MAG: protein translocase subunit SecD [Myxococcales bacterium]|nr:protein translocase subunit SecD [Myxococcales bacterium]MDH5567880.1 protein translocase subunit SecD [Myxococcales bacterium]
MSGLRLRVGLAVALVGFFAFLSISNFVPQARRMESPLLPDAGLRLGLDLQGGIHWVLGAKLDVAVAQELEALRQDLQNRAEEEGFALAASKVEEGRLIVSVDSAQDAEEVREWAGRTNSLRDVHDDGARLEYALLGPVRDEVRKRGMSQVLEVLRRRIADPVHGIPDSVVTRQGDDRVLVQIPGGQIDRSRARELLRVTGFLEFKIVKESDQTEELLRARHPEGLPEDTVIAFERDKETDRVLTAYLLEKTPAITGDHLKDARVGFDRQQRPIVEFTFNTQGAKIFGDVTGANVGERLAIVLDDRVYSAPVIRSRIGARGQIEGRFSAQEAADLAVVLRAGSLPIPVEIEEERTVGPALGADSIGRGLRASVIGLVAIVLFTIGYYRFSGIYASAALFANLLLLMGIMSLFEATLTMPGIAGIVLTVGMAVDANVIIFERIREELRAGKTPRGAIATGFNKAFWTIMDANITTLITALVLFEYGTGPIKGFAVTLSIGVVTSVFAALVLTRLMFALRPGTRPVESLSI